MLILFAVCGPAAAHTPVSHRFVDADSHGRKDVRDVRDVRDSRDIRDGRRDSRDRRDVRDRDRNRDRDRDRDRDFDRRDVRDNRDTRKGREQEGDSLAEKFRDHDLKRIAAQQQSKSVVGSSRRIPLTCCFSGWSVQLQFRIWRT
jgi:hypothetical protein